MLFAVNSGNGAARYIAGYVAARASRRSVPLACSLSIKSGMSSIVTQWS